MNFGTGSLHLDGATVEGLFIVRALRWNCSKMPEAADRDLLTLGDLRLDGLDDGLNGIGGF